jgi:hypothetical protein
MSGSQARDIEVERLDRQIVVDLQHPSYRPYVKVVQQLPLCQFFGFPVEPFQIPHQSGLILYIST